MKNKIGLLVVMLSLAGAAQQPTPLGSNTMLTAEKIGLALGFNPAPSVPGLPLTGGTLTGPLILSGDPTTSAQAANRNYVDVSAACPLRNATTFCVTNSTYNASGAGLTTTTTSGTFAAGTSGSIASCSTFLPNQGVFITGADSAGANYIGTIMSCVGTALVVTPATSTSVANGTVVQHDETAAFQSAITALTSTGGKILVPDGTYLVNGPLQDPSGANAILKMPTIALGSGPASIPIAIVGFTPITGFGFAGGAQIITSANAGNLIGGYAAANTYHFTSTNLFLENLYLHSTQANPCITMVNAQNVATASMKQLLITSAGTSTPSCATGAGLLMPHVGNDVRNVVDQVSIAFFYKGTQFGEHVNGGSLFEASVAYGLVVDPILSLIPATSGAEGNSLHRFWCQLCTHQLAGGASQATINIDEMDAEVPVSDVINDPSNYIHGVVNLQVPYADGRSTSTPAAPVITGATNIKACNLLTLVGCGGGGAVLAPVSLSNLLENWRSQEGAGSTLLNTASDYANPLTSTAVTWNTASGFTGNVATYDGTSSFSVAASATNTSFIGTTAFSSCAWINPSSLPAGDLIIDGNIDGNTSPFVGWRFEIYNIGGTGDIALYLINTFGSNFIFVHGPYNAVPAGTTSHVCFSYDGSRTAAGVKLYINGVSQTATVGANSLTATIASALPVTVGANSGSPATEFFPGAIGRVSIFSRVLSAAEIAAMNAARSSTF